MRNREQSMAATVIRVPQRRRRPSARQSLVDEVFQLLRPTNSSRDKTWSHIGRTFPTASSLTATRADGVAVPVQLARKLEQVRRVFAQKFEEGDVEFEDVACTVCHTEEVGGVHRERVFTCSRVAINPEDIQVTCSLYHS